MGDYEITLEKALQWQRADNIVWIDARTREQFDSGHRQGAFLLNEQEWNNPDTFIELTHRSDKRFVVYCNLRKCKASKKIADEMRARGFPEVFVLKGGWEVLKDAPQP